MGEEKEKGEEEIKEDLGRITKHILHYFRSDKLMIILFIIALLACAYTIYTVGDYQQKINDHWIKQYEDLNCVCSTFPLGFNESPILPLTNIELPVKNGAVT